MGLQKLFGNWIKWLAEEIRTAIKDINDILPRKAQQEVCTYWCVAPLHDGFSKDCNEVRKKFNFSLESFMKGLTDMRVIKLKDWEPADPRLVEKDRFTEFGMNRYWEVIDSAFRFNITRHELYLARKLCAKATSMTGRCNETPQEDKEEKTRKEEDDIPRFFKKHLNDRFHWRNDQMSCHTFKGYHHKRGNRFFLPRPTY